MENLVKIAERVDIPMIDIAVLLCVRSLFVAIIPFRSNNAFVWRIIVGRQSLFHTLSLHYQYFSLYLAVEV